jgi:hypothetical protein
MASRYHKAKALILITSSNEYEHNNSVADKFDEQIFRLDKGGQQYHMVIAGLPRFLQ